MVTLATPDDIVSVQKPRIHSIDILRGIIMVIMALDHVRDFYSNAPYDPLDLTKTSALMFFTRWITHLCAPTFIFLSGTSAYLSLSKRKTKKEASLFLLSRGLWLVFLELTIIGFGWRVDPLFHIAFLQVIWAIGWSMVILSALIFMRPVYVGLFGLVLIFGHNAFDWVKADNLGHYRDLWYVLHEQAFFKLTNYETVFLLYPLIPWVGVMAAGYAFGMLFKLPQPERRKLFIGIGLGSLVLFVVLRYFDVYGDPLPHEHYAIWWKNALAFIKVQKYPPSLLYLLATLGISIIALALLENLNNGLSRIFTVYGRVPMFYYILHVYLVHFSQIAAVLLSGFTVKQLQDGTLPGWGFNLAGVYLIWLSIVVILYYPCRWFNKVKQRRNDWWLSYI